LAYDLHFKAEKEYFEARVMPTSIQEDGKSTVIVIVRDTTEQKHKDDISKILETVFEEATEGIIIEDAERNIIHVNPAMLRILNVEEEMLLGDHFNFLSQMLTTEVKEKIHDNMEKEGHWFGEVEISIPGNKSILAWLTIDIVRDKTGQTSNVVVMLTDISEIHISRIKMQHLATHDSLTDLPNRALLFEHLNHSILTANRNGNKGALLFIDIDGFKDINDNYSHKTGDQLLKDFALRLSDISRKSDIVGRLSGDEFLLILENIEEMDDILWTVEKVKAQLMEPFLISEISIDITVSIGIACYPTDGETADQLIHAADQAMYHVKKNGKDGFSFYNKEFSLLSSEYFFIQKALRKALREDDFTILYQPQFSLRDGSLTGIEALLRCNNSDVKDIPISRLISIAEESNIINNISRFVMHKCCNQIKTWQDLSGLSLKIAVNLSRKELSDKDLVHVIKDNLSYCHINPMILEFEITESTLLQNNRMAKQNIEQLRALGCSFSIDDYGTGFSSLSNLREFKLDKIKIDRSFIEDLENNDNDKIIVSATINMVKELGLTALAEGVENEAQEALLKSYGCDEVQGYYYSYPLTAEQMTKLLLKHK
jgi:diguanylate cyclase (GGDEF)-like protein/PAS domain S-box-containing protein